MDCKYYMKHIKEELEGCEEYYEHAKMAKEKGNMEAAQYLMKIANDEYSHADILFKLLEDHVEKMTKDETYTGVYKDIFDMSMSVLKDDFKEMGEYLKKI